MLFLSWNICSGLLISRVPSSQITIMLLTKHIKNNLKFVLNNKYKLIIFFLNWELKTKLNEWNENEMNENWTELRRRLLLFLTNNFQIRLDCVHYSTRKPATPFPVTSINSRSIPLLFKKIISRLPELSAHKLSV